MIVRGAVVANARTASSGTVSFEIDDGSGPLRIVFGASLAADADEFASGTWVEVRGVLGQETTGAQPLRGYRVWPRGSGDVRILAGATGAAPRPTRHPGPRMAVARPRPGRLPRIGQADLRVGATLVASAWPELGVAGLLWDGVRLVGIAPASGPRVEQVLEGRALPLSLELVGLREPGRARRRRASVWWCWVKGAATRSWARGLRHRRRRTMPGQEDPPAWVAVVGHVKRDGARQVIEVDGGTGRHSAALRR